MDSIEVESLLSFTFPLMEQLVFLCVANLSKQLKICPFQTYLKKKHKMEAEGKIILSSA